ncbi:cytochrome d ubiquinol oxidase subunit II [Conexibacter stalactiti]|uniref:Cytochrome d ubiquinol oxidase subunit II n=1 Tax=Conexibacter stalactiti TaxID=1940611 RepID=A0ABU4HWX1_9ACTN|nr:cytochrome d ubiquinol oxidase subunit II [Conexibacter stalactiti]MDW5597157.1 cytochrome d ubiquinol oxidase subunit II [Conexibacter stalactiti]MEC5037799.1 cytochrome d ubiquinol oxidase subunit II [Conexibacter stalactiti]
MSDLSLLQSIWFVAIVGLWVLYLVLEGFDFGVGMLMRRVRRDHADRRVALHTIGPTWAANEVWVVVAVVAMFGAFPEWYAAWSSALYLPLFVVLLSLVSRNAAIELIGKREGERWRAGWERVLLVASTVAPFCWGLMWSAVVGGLELRGGEVVAGPLDVVSWYSVLGGLSLVVVCRALGAAFLTLRTDGDVRVAASRSLRFAAPVAFVVVSGFVVWTVAGFGAPGVVGWIACAGCVVALATVAAAGWRVGAGTRAASDGGDARAAAVAFGAGCAAIGLLVVTWFAVLFPAGIAGADGGAPLTLADAAAGSYTLTLMTIVAGLLLPVLIGLQAWSYWLFRHRMTRADVGAPLPSPVDVVTRVVGGSGPESPAAPNGPGFRRRRQT